MFKEIKKKIKSAGKRYFEPKKIKENTLAGCRSYAQAGEDKIIELLFKTMSVENIRYLEVGTNDPVFGNNTYLFYRQHYNGVCIEANPDLIKRIKSKRPKDVVLNVGIAEQDDSFLDFYVFGTMDENKGLSTFSKEAAEHVLRTLNTNVEKVIRIPTMTINKVLDQYFKTKAPEILSIDAEGIDLQILKSLNFDKYRPTVICVETVSFTTDHKKLKDVEILEFMKIKNYFVYADSGINTIFVDRVRFDKA